MHFFRADTSRRHQPERIKYASGLVGENVALHVLKQHNAVELGRIYHQLIGRIIKQDGIVELTDTMWDKTKIEFFHINEING